MGTGRHREHVRGTYRFRTTRFRARLDDGDDGTVEAALRTTSGCAVSCSTPSGGSRRASSRSGAISNDVWIRVGRDLDLEDQRLDI